MRERHTTAARTGRAGSAPQAPVPVLGPPLLVCDGYDLNAGLGLAIDDVVWESLEDVPTGARLERGPDLGCSRDERDRPVDLAQESLSSPRASLEVPLESVLQLPVDLRDVLNLSAAHAAS